MMLSVAIACLTGISLILYKIIYLMRAGFGDGILIPLALFVISLGLAILLHRKAPGSRNNEIALLLLLLSGLGLAIYQSIGQLLSMYYLMYITKIITGLPLFLTSSGNLLLLMASGVLYFLLLYEQFRRKPKDIFPDLKSDEVQKPKNGLFKVSVITGVVLIICAPVFLFTGLGDALRHSLWTYAGLSLIMFALNIVTAVFIIMTAKLFDNRQNRIHSQRILLIILAFTLVVSDFTQNLSYSNQNFFIYLLSLIRIGGEMVMTGIYIKTLLDYQSN